MTAYDKIQIAGLATAEEYGLNNLEEKMTIPFYEKETAVFINTIIEDLNEFQTLEQFLDTKVLFSKASLFVFGKAAEFAISHRFNTPITKITYDFDLCMTAQIAGNIPEPMQSQITKYEQSLLHVYDEMYSVTKKNQEALIHEGKTFNDCMFRILSGIFFIGKKVGLSINLDENSIIHFPTPLSDKKYDYDTYDGKYNSNESYF